MTPEDRSAIKAQARRDRKRTDEAVRALIWSGWKLDIKVEGTDDRLELFIWSAERGAERYVVAADNHVSPLVELQRVTGAQEPVAGTR